MAEADSATVATRVAVACVAGGVFSIEEVSLDAPRDDEILVEIAAVGICHTDLVAASGMGTALPVVLGHEGAGVVRRIGRAVSKVAVGDRVVLTLRACGGCAPCAVRQPSYCCSKFALNFAGTRPDGSHTMRGDGGALFASFFGQSSFATHALAYESNVVRLPDDIPLSIAAPLGCGVQTGAGAVLRSLDCRPGSSIVVLGAGSVGLSAVMAANLRGCPRIIAIEPHADRRDLALQFGATDVLGAVGAGELAATILSLVPGGVDYAIDTSGRPELVEALVGALAPLGKLGILGLPPSREDVLRVPIASVMSKGLTIRGIVEGDSDPDVFIPELIDVYRAGKFPFDRMIRPYAFDDINRAASDQHHGDCVKPVLLVNPELAA